MRVATISRIVAAFLTGVSLLFLLPGTPVRSAERPSLLYATAQVGAKMVAFNLQAHRVRVIGNIGLSGVMTKTINCTECHRCIKIEGSVEGLREILFRVNCPYCEKLNEITWPMAGDFVVGRCDEDEISK